MSEPYAPHRPSRPHFRTLRGLRMHCHEWGSDSLASAERPLLVLVHGWMDVGASFQFLVDALAALEGPARWIVALDWRGFGLSDNGGSDSYWFPDYLGDLEALLDSLNQPGPIDLLGHSMGGNVVMSYAGVRPERIRRVVNLEGFGLPASRPDQSPKRLAAWLDELKQPQALRSYTSLDAVAAKLQQNNPRLAPDKAQWLAGHWAAQREDGQWHILGDPAHKRLNPVLYRVEEILEQWKRISAPLLWVEADGTDVAKWWGSRYTREEFHQRLNVVPSAQRELLRDAGHMLHHDQPEALANLLARFLSTP